jgi:hypothetical protein
MDNKIPTEESEQKTIDQIRVVLATRINFEDKELLGRLEV